MSWENEQRRNEWAARMLGLDPLEGGQGVYRDDNCFVDRADEEGKTVAFIVLDSNGHEVLMAADGHHGWAVPDDLKLGLV